MTNTEYRTFKESYYESMFLIFKKDTANFNYLTFSVELGISNYNIFRCDSYEGSKVTKDLSNYKL